MSTLRVGATAALAALATVLGSAFLLFLPLEHRHQQCTRHDLQFARQHASLSRDNNGHAGGMCDCVRSAPARCSASPAAAGPGPHRPSHRPSPTRRRSLRFPRPLRYRRRRPAPPQREPGRGPRLWLRHRLPSAQRGRRAARRSARLGSIHQTRAGACLHAPRRVTAVAAGRSPQPPLARPIAELARPTLPSRPRQRAAARLRNPASPAGRRQPIQRSIRTVEIEGATDAPASRRYSRRRRSRLASRRRAPSHGNGQPSAAAFRLAR